MSDGERIDAGRVIADLRELDRRTGGAGGAQRLAWGDGWLEARAFLTELLAELGLEPEPERDAAGNLWARIEGADPDLPALAVGSHLDSVPGGGWLDGALGVMAALGVLRAAVAAPEPPPAGLVLVDWADEEGARFGRSLFGSSAFSGSLDTDRVAGLRDADGRPIAEVLAGHGVELARAREASARLDGLGAYLELHIEQGPRMEADGIDAAAVSGCAGVERLRLEFAGQSAHAGTTPMDARRDAGLAAAEAALEIERLPDREGGVATTGELVLEPGVPTAVAGRARLGVDLRHPDPAALARLLDGTRRAGAAAAERRRCGLAESPVWRIEPIDFDPGLVELAARACADVADEPATLASGALHDAAEVARVLPAAMVFSPSRGGISHAREEDTDERSLTLAIEAFGLCASRAVAGLGGL